MKNSFLTFLLDSNICAVDISNVLEVLNYGNFTVIPGAKNYIEGLIYSREQGITVINLRKKFALKDREADKNTKIVVISVKKQEGETEKITLYGLVADRVLDVQFLEEDEIQEKYKTTIPKENIKKALKLEDKTVFVLEMGDL
ncbi:chemotaxis protein CheW [uncultured Treponema sp.]|uniref:chemotaxis protein CheW n=1 Tax=uncultured Treponema sp. TaxID=162155 RepID=UPI0015BFDE27|nr:chemotaxis protein CheW [uncultured Treponema sp.]